MDLPALLRASLNQHLKRGLGFLPRQVPADVLPDEWSPWVEAARMLPEHFHGNGARDWLAARFGKPVPGIAAGVAALAPHEADRLLTVLSVLGHAFRWDCVPPTAAEYARTRLALPPGLEAPWAALCARSGHPRVGNLASMVTTNWRLPGYAGGADYPAEALLHGGAEPAVLWLCPPSDEALRAFLRTGIETEAVGARLVLTAVRLVEAATAGNAHRCGWLLERLHGELTDIGAPFRTYIQKQRFTPSDFMTLIQPPTLWGLDEGEGVLEGASGPQVGALQVADALLNVSRASLMGQSVLATRRFLPARHRHFLELMDLAAPRVREFVLRSGDRQLAGLFNACVSALKAWRLVHQKRGAMFLKAEGGQAPAAYASTGGVVAKEDERVERFEASMRERVHETDAAFVPRAAEVGAPRPLAHLSDEDHDAMAAAAWRREAVDGEVVLAAGVSGAGLFVIRSGQASVEAPGGGVLAVLPEGTVFGEVSYLDNRPTSAVVRAVGPLALDVIPREHLHVLCETRSGFGERLHLSLAVLLAERVRGMNHRVAPS